MSIFLVEDDPQIRSFLMPLIQSTCDAPVAAWAETEEDAVEWLQAHAEWHLAVLDVMLKEGSGLNVLSRCQTRRAEQIVVMLTNTATAEVHARAASLGANAIFDKTTELEKFLDFCWQRRKPCGLLSA